MIGSGLEIGNLTIADDLLPLVQRLCFEAVEVLVKPQTCYIYPYHRPGATLLLEATDDGVGIDVSGEEVEQITLSRPETLVALYACGLRYVGRLQELQTLDDAARSELAQLLPFQRQARAALADPGPGCGAAPNEPFCNRS